MANLFPPDLWDYVNGFDYQSEGSIAPFAYYDPLKKLCSQQQYYSLCLCHCWSRTPLERGGCMKTLCKYNAAKVTRHIRTLQTLYIRTLLHTRTQRS